ncbi:hypothetical protein DH2020_029100 [Rehmannia glutinosa]|uniref:RING-type E3 ubiquitin transferase n=1 Tax=Rehmannia glutinosa TaxID=99300 RepID=A0ABR0VTS6_REHGL
MLPLKMHLLNWIRVLNIANRIGCSGRIKSSQNTRIGSLGKAAKCSKPSFRSSNGNEKTRKSSESSSVMTRAKKPYLDSKRKSPSQVKFDPSGSSLSSESELTTSSVPSTYRSSLNRSNGGIYGLRNLKCDSMSDVVRTSCSPVESESVRKNVTRKRSLEGESSLSRRERKTTTSGISISDSRRSNSASGEDSASVWTRRSMTVNPRTSPSYRQNGRNYSSVREPSVSVAQFPDNELPSRVGGRSSSLQFCASGSRSYNHSSSNGDNPSATTLFASGEHGFTHLMNDDVLRRYNMGGFEEILLALERIEQDEELTHEDLLALETSLFLGGLNLYDQHRDMRLDIDNMSYEELLALEERMGTVSTALSEEALSKCLRRSIYQLTPSKVQITGSGEDGNEIKCSICQEEYVSGDEIGTLVECRHGYHITCINQWLQVKNWCPICKTSVASSQTSSLL